LLIRETVKSSTKQDSKKPEETKNGKQGEEDFDNQFIAQSIDDVEVDPKMVTQAREELNQGIYKSQTPSVQYS
jgi:hypothetical protein